MSRVEWKLELSFAIALCSTVKHIYEFQTNLTDDGVHIIMKLIKSFNPPLHLQFIRKKSKRKK